MSRVGKKPIPVPKGVTVTLKGADVHIKGPKGELSFTFHPDTVIEYKDNVIQVSRKSNVGFQRALHGTARAIIANMIKGVTEGFERKLEIVGVGYKAEAKGKMVQFNLGFSHPILFAPPAGIEVSASSPTAISVKGIDKQLVGQVAAKIRSFKPPEPYQGKGVKYAVETVRRKAGKAATKK